MTRFETSWEIAKRSWAVLRSDKALAWFPVLSALASVAVGLVCLALVAGLGLNSSSTGDSLAPIGWVLVAFAYVALAFVQTYFLAALVAGADARLQGRPGTVRDALDVANSRLHRLLPWAIVSATVTVILNQLERQGIVGAIVGRLVGLAWALVTFLTVPVLVIEDIGIGAALTRSKDLFKKTWGENVVGQAGLGIVGFLLMIPGVLVFGIGAALGTAGLVVLGPVAVVWLVGVSVAVAAMSGIYRTALYRFASTGEIPSGFEGVDFDAAFRPRRTRGGNGSFGGFGGGFGGFTNN